VEQLPPFEEYEMSNRTYRYFTGKPLYPFGYGLSYTTFRYTDLNIPEKTVAGSDLSISVQVTNTGSAAGDEVVQLYLTDEKASTPRPLRQLEGFRRIHLKAGESAAVSFTVKAEQFSIINAKDIRVIEPGWFTIAVGGRQPSDNDSQTSQVIQVLNGRVRLTGKEVVIKE
jgi:beta-glucosidase